MRTMIKKVCKVCDKEFEVKLLKSPAYSNIGQFCSVTCRQKRPRKPSFDQVKALELWESGLSCNAIADKVNSTDITVRKWLLSINRFEKRYSKGKNRYNWKDKPKERRTQRLRKKLLKQRGETCCKCGYKEYKEVLEIHHMDGNKFNDEWGNLSLLCPNCHAEHHFTSKTGKWRIRT